LANWLKQAGRQPRSQARRHWVVIVRYYMSFWTFFRSYQLEGSCSNFPINLYYFLIDCIQVYQYDVISWRDWLFSKYRGSL
jgi:hypothetical protein